MRSAILVLAASALVAPSTARAGRTEIIVGGGIVSPATSQYRYTTEALGYDRRSFRLGYEVEVGAIRALNYWLSVGPLARVYLGKLGAPYDDLPSIRTYGLSVAARIEADLFPRPRLFVWADPSIGRGWIGLEGNTTARDFWGVRAGVGIGTVRENWSVRFRIGYGSSPTFSPVTLWTGPFDFGGWFFQLDGVLRVLP